jgi:hypothetical protein
MFTAEAINSYQIRKSINHKGHKGFTQRSQRSETHDFDFVLFVHS